MDPTKLREPADTRCNNRQGNRPCGGGLFRTLDGADKLSEHFGRIVVQCDKCGVRLSVKIGD